ncbi:MAG: YbhB/YbcL family Raf kinase inhibitor-like protein [Candidatus Heimdallarchaeota archaeon]|nr:YbhB/YbcL family Raf kinase inhibitor-like protein [Candidatus Heimdallarchaeota archaeon]
MGKLELTSPAFKHNTLMPSKYTCQGEEINPPLKINGVPKGTKSLALIMEDPDVPIPKVVVTHWIICHLDPKVKAIEEGSKLEDAIIGKNLMRKNKYLGPCPPWGTHRYIFTLFALDEKLPFTTRSAKKDLLKKIKGHIIEQTELIGLYSKKK